MEEYTREQAEQVLKDWKKFFGGTGKLYSKDKEWLDHKFPNRVNGWYKTKADGCKKWLAYFDFDKEIAFGFNVFGNWQKFSDTSLFDTEKDYLADEQEVKDRLTAYAKELGFVKGVKYQTPTGSRYNFEGVYNSRVINNRIMFLLDPLVENGEWAKIVETVTLSQFPADNFVTINGVKYVRQD